MAGPSLWDGTNLPLARRPRPDETRCPDETRRPDETRPCDNCTHRDCRYGSRCFPASPQVPVEWTIEDQVTAPLANKGFAQGPYVRGGTIGSGGYGRVFKVMRLSDQKLFAGKAPRIVAGRFEKKICDEAKVMRGLTHEHLLAFVDLYQEEGNPRATLLVTDWCRRGTLATYIDDAVGVMTAQSVLRVIKQIASALDYLHSRALLHGDLKPYNILVRSARDPIDVVLADLGEVRLLEPYGRAQGTRVFWSPATAKRKRHEGLSDDVWALGRTAMAMTRQEPTPHPANDLEVQLYPMRCAKHARSLLELNDGHELVRLISCMLLVNGPQRPRAKEVCAAAERTLESLKSKGAEHWSRQDKLGIQGPQGHRPYSFW